MVLPSVSTVHSEHLLLSNDAIARIAGFCEKTSPDAIVVAAGPEKIYRKFSEKISGATGIHTGNFAFANTEAVILSAGGDVSGAIDAAVRAVGFEASRAQRLKVQPEMKTSDKKPQPAGLVAERVPVTPSITGANRPVQWALPSIESILEPGIEGKADAAFDQERARVIEETLLAFGAPARVVEINRGPTITQFGVEPDYIEGRGGRRTKVKVSKISALADDLALALAAPSIRIEAPVPRKGFVGVEVPNAEVSLVSLRDVM